MNSAETAIAKSVVATLDNPLLICYLLTYEPNHPNHPGSPGLRDIRVPYHASLDKILVPVIIPDMMQDAKSPLSPQLGLPNFWQRLWPKLGFLRNIISSIPLFLIVGAYAYPDSWAVRFVGMEKHRLAVMIHIEAFAIGIFPLLVAVSRIKPGASKALKAIKAGLLFGFMFLFCSGVWDYYGSWGFFAFISLTIATYAGFFINAAEARVLINIVLRWCVNYVTFLLVAIVLGMPQEVAEWIHHKEIYNCGISFFFIIGVFELTGFYRAKWIERLSLAKKISQLEEEIKETK